MSAPSELHEFMAAHKAGEALNKRLFAALRELRATCAAPRHSPIAPFYSALQMTDKVLQESWPRLADAEACVIITPEMVQPGCAAESM